MAVPGSLQNRAALGTNQLIRDGAQPVTEVSDILVALGLDGRRASVHEAFDPRPLPRGVDATVLERCGRDPCTIEAVVSDLGLPVPEAAMALARLERAGWLREAGGWFERVTRWGVDA
jgi:DNA processing protein